MSKLTVTEIKQILGQVDKLDDDFLVSLREDERKSVQTAIRQCEKRLINQQKMIEAHHQRLEIEASYYQQGHQVIAGVDEVGRGPLAGPVVVAAVILPKDCEQHLIGVNDSKQLSHAQRLVYADMIRSVALAIEVVVYEPALIDQHNIYQATRLAMTQAVTQLAIRPDCLLIDAMQLDVPITQASIIKGDQKSLSIAAASIIAKVHRDQLMVDYATLYPEFGFEQHMGYGTPQHLAALRTYGYTPIHRKSFEPIKSMAHQYKSRPI